MANIENQQPEYKYTEKNTLKNWFKSKLKPTQAQFWAWMDSYWHKGEKLPISTIDGLGEAVDGKAPIVHYHNQYATNDANSLSVENVEQWKKKLDVDNLQFDDQAISLTNEYVDFGLTSDSKQAQFNQSIYNSNQTKLNKPSYEGTTDEYPYLVGIDTEGYSANISIDQIGKVKTINNQDPDENGNIKIEEEFVKNGTGWSLKYRKDNPSFYGTLGQNALDLSYTTSANTFEPDRFSWGANGMNSFTVGYKNSAMGNGSIVAGSINYSQGQTNHIISYRSVIREDRGSANKGKYSNGIFAGEGNEITNSMFSVILGSNSSSVVGEANANNKNYYNALNAILSGSQNKITSNANCSVILGGALNVSQGINQLVSGSRNQAVTYGETLVGVYGTVQDTSLPPSDYVSNARMFNVGVGTWYGQNQDDFIRKDGLSVFWNGLVTAPTVNNVDIENNSKALTTKEFIENKISNFPLPTNWSHSSQRFSGLLDKSADATYNNLLGIDSNGNVAKVGLNALTNVMAKSSDAQKEAFRLASRKSTETYSVGQARVDFVNPPIIDKTKNYNQYVTIIGINLFLNPATTILKFRHQSTQEVRQITNFQTQQTNAQVLVISELFSDWTDGNWEILIENNGINNIVNNVTLEIAQNLISSPVNLTWENLKVSNDAMPENMATTANSINMTGSVSQDLTVHSSVLVSEIEKEQGCMIAIEFSGASTHNINYNIQSNYYIGFIGVNDQPLLTTNVEVGFHVVNTYQSTAIDFLPSNTGAGIAGMPIVDTIYFMFKGNICTMYFFQKNKLQIVTTNALKGDLGLKVYRNQGNLVGGNLNLNIATKYVKNIQNRP
ncbi:hypothetical protein [Empedobacter sp. UBA7248]|uniref:hypothetical protein n=1 Tax=Empedobacter sp. UBA7248 TaxID=1946448 RepID=UPI0025C64F1B|nr:hypothetical protein [Empedobacter sp. UBA7248]